MSSAQPQYRGASYRITMRCAFRKMMLLPQTPVSDAIGYWLGVVSQEYGVAIHAVAVMSNHLHLDVTDCEGRLSQFRAVFKGTLSRALNCYWGRWGYLWAEAKDGISEVATAADAAAGMAYSIANPTSAGLVASPTAWPGLISRASDLGATPDACAAYTYKRPEFFFRDAMAGGRTPDEVTWSLVPHPLGADAPEAFVADVRRRVAARVEAKRAEVRAEGGRFLGAASVLRKKWFHTPNTPSPRRKLNPRVICSDSKQRVAMLMERQAFRDDYIAARKLWNDTGKAVFPVGTNKMKGWPGVTIRDGPLAFKRAA